MIFPTVPYQSELLAFFAVFSSGLLSIIAISSLTTPKFDYNGKHVIVTGGSSGIGLECAKKYAKKGANVTIIARDKGRLSAAVIEVEACKVAGRRVMSISVDTASSQVAVNSALASCLRQNGAADVLLNCAGISVAGEFDQLDSADFDRMMRVNVLGSIYPTRAVLEGMKLKGNGRIVFVSSQAGQAAIHGFSAYAPSKWALRGLAEALQMEVKPFGILVSVAYPPDTDTPGYKEEMISKPEITKKLSESGSVFSPVVVANDIVTYSAKGYFGISTGLDGWLLKQVHPGMTPCNNIWEVTQGILFSPLCRFIALFYILAWEWECNRFVKKQGNKNSVATTFNGNEGEKEGVEVEVEVEVDKSAPTMITRGSAMKAKRT